jgi:iron(III) transport system substrate-binding protein
MKPANAPAPWIRPPRARGLAAFALAVLLPLAAGPAAAQEKILNLYSARHYQTDEKLYGDFTKSTGIAINRIELGDEALLERLRTEGDRSPADVVILVDAARLWKAQSEGLFQPAKSAVLDQRIPESFHSADGSWYGMSSRARVILYDKTKVDAADVDTYEKLADPKNKGKVCTRSGSHPYNLSLFASLLERHGTQKTRELLKGIVANQARAPKGGDTDQIKGVASGECQVAVANSYYWARLVASKKPEDQEVVSKVTMLFPNQATTGTQLNLSGAAIARHAPHRDAAVKFLEYLSSDTAQAYFANGNNEWPTVMSAKVDNPTLAGFGKFKADTLPVETLGRRSVEAQKLLNEVGYR